jgi:hypothetical protein
MAYIELRQISACFRGQSEGTLVLLTLSFSADVASALNTSLLGTVVVVVFGRHGVKRSMTYNANR